MSDDDDGKIQNKSSFDEEKKRSLSFRLDGDVAELFEKTREAASKRPEYWAFARLTKADFARQLLLTQLLKVAEDLGTLPKSDDEQ